MNLESRPLGRATIAGLFVAIVLLSGTIGYILLGLTLVDAAYQTAITITTVGFGEITPEGAEPTTAYRLFTLVLVLGGFSTVLFAAGVFVESVVESQIGTRREKRMQKEVDKVSGHLIICGYGRVGRAVVERAVELEHSAVVIEADEDAVKECGQLYVIGDASDDDVLRRAGVERASSLVGALPTDAANLFLAVSARRLNQEIRLATRANAHGSAEKLRAMDIDTVVEPYQMAGARLATGAIRPHTSDYLDQVFSAESSEVELIELTVTAGSNLVNSTVVEVGKTGAVVVAIRHSGEEHFRNASGFAEPFRVGDVAIALGDRATLDALGQESS